MTRDRLLLTLLGLALALVGCEQGAEDDDCRGPDDPSCGVAWEALSRPGDYEPDPVALENGAAIVAYDDVEDWDDGAHCAGGITPGGRSLSTYLRANFPGISSIGGYACRPNTANTAKMSVHGSGRALDIMIPMDSGAADNDVGDRIANWLIANSSEIGVQYLIWDRTQWSGSRTTNRVRRYTGPNPHIDHIHAELTLSASREETPFYRLGGITTPVEETEVCNGLDDDFDGAIDEGGVCDLEPEDAGVSEPDAWATSDDAGPASAPDAGALGLDDAGAIDAGARVGAPLSSDCSCRVVGGAGRGAPPLAVLTLLGLALGVRRRSGRVRGEASAR